MTIRLSDEVRQALTEGKPVVALETTIVAHGMPEPTNIETALGVEAILREGGAIPASVGLVDGDIVCGLSPAELDRLAHDEHVVKAQERDLGRAVRNRLTGATTVGATLLVATHCGIEVHVTGGIGGVAPEVGMNLDISADLPAIARSPVITIAAGTKAFMDTAATLEAMETLGVPVGVWQANEFPWFYSTSSGLKVEWQVNSADEIAEIFRADRALRPGAGMFLGVPLLAPDALPAEQTRAAIDTALKRMREQGITGKAATPFLLSTIFEETAGESLRANVALIKNNARVGAQVAVAVAKTRMQ